MSDLQYLEEMYRAGVRGYFDIYSANAFGMDRPPEDPASPNVLNFQRVTLQREIMERYGDGNKAIWFNECGWNAAPDTIPAEKRIWRQVSEAQQAEYTIRGIELAQEEWPWAGVFMIWYFRQVGNIPTDDATYYFRMVEPDFTPRMLYFAVQDVARQPTLPGPGRYEETNPHVERYGEWDTILDLDASAHGMIQSDKPGSSIAFRFRGTGLNLITQRGPLGGRFIVSLDGQSIGELPRTPQGKTYVELHSPDLEPLTTIPLVRDASSGEHTLRLTLAEGESGIEEHLGVIDAFEVMVERPQFPWASVMGSGVAILLVAWLSWSTWRHARFAIRPQ